MRAGRAGTGAVRLPAEGGSTKSRSNNRAVVAAGGGGLTGESRRPNGVRIYHMNKI